MPLATAFAELDFQLAISVCISPILLFFKSRSPRPGDPRHRPAPCTHADADPAARGAFGRRFECRVALC